jgi:hypothetical protein
MESKEETAMFEVIVTNSILGNSRRVMSMQELEKFNVCALACAKAAAQDGKSHSMGMWTVKLAEGTEQQLQPDTSCRLSKC